MVELRTMLASDYPAVAAIFRAGIEAGDSTFETDAPDWPAWDAGHLAAPRLVAELAGPTGLAVVGWAALSPTSDRCVYGGVAEVSVYVDPAHHRRGVGRALLAAVIEHSEAGGIWTLQSGVFPENLASVALHEQCGFRVVGRRERLGRMGDAWRDVLLLERRSPVVG